MQKIKSLFLVLILSFFSLTLFACGNKLAKKDDKTKNLLDQSWWHKEGYKQGDYGNVSKLDENGYAIEDNRIPDSRTLPYVKYGYKDRDGVIRYKKAATNAYVETNDWNPLNVLRYEIGDTGVPYFDIVTFFAANIVHGPTGKPEPYFNGGIKALLENAEKTIRPIQRKGTRVVLDFLPHHQGWGYYNMRGADLDYFLTKIGEIMDKYGLDGIDIDEEYAEYGKHIGQPGTHDDAPSEFVREFRKRFPKKILSVFNYNIGFNDSVYEVLPDGTKKYMIDFAYNNYGHSGATPSWVHKKNHSSYSVECNWGLDYNTTKSQARDAIQNNRSMFMYFNPHFDRDNSRALSGLTQELYGHPTRDTGIFYNTQW